jgi:hypothetical protein
MLCQPRSRGGRVLWVSQSLHACTRARPGARTKFVEPLCSPAMSPLTPRPLLSPIGPHVGTNVDVLPCVAEVAFRECAAPLPRDSAAKKAAGEQQRAYGRRASHPARAPLSSHFSGEPRVVRAAQMTACWRPRCRALSPRSGPPRQHRFIGAARCYCHRLPLWFILRRARPARGKSRARRPREGPAWRSAALLATWRRTAPARLCRSRCLGACFLVTLAHGICWARLVRA